MKKIKLFSMFSGFGGAEFALKKAKIDFECIGFSEIDKYAVQCYEQNHCLKFPDMLKGEIIRPNNYGDCTKINPNSISQFDLLTAGFPCQSFSVAGKGLGELDTRGTLFNEIIRIAEVKQPKYMLLENVKGLTNKNHKETFNKIIFELQRIGYYVHWKVLNSKDYGIPQNRARVWFVCFRNISEYETFKFPEKEELKIFLKDILEDEVDEKYYLKEEYTKKLLMPKTSYCIDANYAKGTNIKGYLEKKRRQIIQTCQAVITPDRINKRQNGRRFKTDGEPSFTLNTQDRHGVLLNGLTIRKLTPTECFRLQGFVTFINEYELDYFMKTCTKCRELKDIEDFSLRNIEKGWRASYCKKCFSENARNYYSENKEEIRQIRNQDYENNKDEYHKKSKQWRLDNPDKIKAIEKRRYENNKEELLLKNKKYKQDNPEYFKKYREENKEKIYETQKLWREENIDRVRFNERINSAKRRALKLSVDDGTITRDSLKDIWNGKCSICDRKIEYKNKLTHLDHIIPLSKGGKHSIHNVQWTCASCNQHKSDKIIIDKDKKIINLDGLSNTQRYRLAGNGWDVSLVSKIFKEMFK